MTGSPFATATQSVCREISHKEKVLDSSTYHRKLGEFPHNSLELLHVSSRQLRIILKLFTMIAIEVGDGGTPQSPPGGYHSTPPQLLVRHMLPYPREAAEQMEEPSNHYMEE